MDCYLFRLTDVIRPKVRIPTWKVVLLASTYRVPRHEYLIPGLSGLQCCIYAF